MSRLGKLGLLLLTSFWPLAAQMVLTTKAQEKFSWLLEKDGKGGPLDCHVDTFHPFLDFAFRYEIGYVMRCSLRQFEGKQTSLGTLLRIEHEAARPTTLGQSFVVPGIAPEERSRFDFQHFKQEIQFSGVVAAGEGEYNLDLVIFDEHSRTHRKKWKVKAVPHGNEGEAAVAMRPGTVSEISLPPWKGTSLDGRGLRVAVLLDAAPIHPFSTKLHAWDRAFLLGALSSVLRQMPLASVRLSAFSLDQQVEFFHEDDFDHTGLGRLADSLSRLELATVSYKVLGQQYGAVELLSRMMREEAPRSQSLDAVIVIGPTIRMDEKIAPIALESQAGAGLPFFYFEYYPHLGRDFPDSIQYATSSRGGTTFKLHSPGDLAQAIKKMEKQLQETSASARLSR